jgi:hypothetical protein
MVFNTTFNSISVISWRSVSLVEKTGENLQFCGRPGRNRMVVGFTTTYAISAYHHERCEFESRPGNVHSVQHYVIKFVSDLR